MNRSGVVECLQRFLELGSCQEVMIMQCTSDWIISMPFILYLLKAFRLFVAANSTPEGPIRYIGGLESVRDLSCM